MGIRSTIRTIKKQDPALRTGMEAILYPAFWAMGSHRAAHWLYRHRRYFWARLLSQLSRACTGIEIHPGAQIGRGLFIDHGMGVVIGETCEIGNDVLIYQGVTLGGTGKDTGKRHPTIGNHVMIGAGAKILGPFRVGDNCRIGAGAVVLQEVPDNCTVVGVPGRIISRKVDPSQAIDCHDQIRLPDPVSMEMCRLRTRIEELEKRLGIVSKEDTP